MSGGLAAWLQAGLPLLEKVPEGINVARTQLLQVPLRGVLLLLHAQGISDHEGERPAV
eukprot:CAMPEP_0171121714 /NCGR_PEP_ID=MMETSP0766_2-20121228/103212_1 /TAXON_ID=439317 /ORGANISM="Gambierdiscus australes, Strain CAWD 149" /LENGTH=57 /DNA_ID=CAMNT_0011584505 /DNA_START=16 /DNA_END=184 /DNA_ORIENTATION=-